MPSRVSAYFIHEQIYQNDVWQNHTKQTNMFLKCFFILTTLGRVKSFSVYNIDVVSVLQPNPFGAPMPIDWCIKNWKWRIKGKIQNSTFSSCLSSKDRNGNVSRRKCSKFIAES